MKLVACALFLAACGASAKTYDSLADLQKDQEAAGFVLLGSFDESWPATFREERTAKDEISFSLKGGARQSYPGYAGYTLKVVRLEAAGGKEVVAVFRSTEKS